LIIGLSRRFNYKDICHQNLCAVRSDTQIS